MSKRRKRQKPQPDNLTFFWVGLCICLFGMCTVGAQEITKPTTYSSQRLVRQSEATPIDYSLLPESFREEVREMAKSIPLAREPEPEPARPVVLIPPEEKLTAFDRAVRVVLANEGGFVPRDGNTGEPAMYGINAKWHREAFTKARQITDEHGEEAGRAYAAQYYREHFWDRYGLDALPPETQVVVLDAVVNHRSTFARRVVDAARAGAGAIELLVMRWREYHRLAKAAPREYAESLPGWMNRLEATARAVAAREGHVMLAQNEKAGKDRPYGARN